MVIKVGVNGFGRMGRLTMRAAWEMEGVRFVQVNDPAGDAKTLAHLLNYDSVHGKWAHVAESEGDDLVVSGQRIACMNFWGQFWGSGLAFCLELAET